MEIQTTNEELDLAPQPTFNEIQTILQTMDEEAYDVIDSNQLLKELKTEGYQCQYCSKVLATKYSLQMHTRLHTGEKPHQCSLCEARFSHPTDLRRHLLKHTGEKPYACDVCGAKFTQSGSLKGHSKLHQGEKPHKCTVCAESFVSLGLLRSHARVHNNSKSFRCTYCEQTFEDVKQVVEHCKLFHATPVDIEQNTDNPDQLDQVAPQDTDISHTSDPLLVEAEEKVSATFVDMSTILVSRRQRKKKCLCEVCGRLLSSLYALKLHSRIHNGERPYACDQCEYKSACQSDLKRHYMKHTGEKPFKCDTCDKSFAQSNTLKQHKRIHEENTRQSCKACGAHFDKRSVLLKHWFSKHRSKEEPFFCSHCFETFVDRETLRQHKDDAHALTDQITCSQCGMAFTRMCNLRRHEAKSCQGKAHTCEECQETFCRRSGLMEHLRVIHGAPSRFQCEFCDSSFRELYKFKRHKMEKHGMTQEQVGLTSSQKGANEPREFYTCKVCQRQLCSKYNLIRHLKTHEKQKPNWQFTCPFCPGCVFQTRKELRAHKRSTHLKILQCYLCKELFETQLLLTEHKNVAHRNKCQECNATFRTKPLLYAHVTMKHKKFVRCSFVCKTCDNVFYSKSVYTNHLKLHHGSINNGRSQVHENTHDVANGNAQVTSDIDSKITKVPTLEEQQQQKQQSTPKTTATKNGFGSSYCHVDGLPGKSHRKSAERAFECSDCGSAFTLKRYLRRHQSSHTAKKSHVCEQCGNSFKFASHLRKHQKMHTGVKPHVCDICGTGFRAPYTLIIHRRSHTGEKPYECQHCAYKFRCLSDLKRHMVTHDRIERFWCPQCDRGFFTKARLNRHVRVHNGDKRYACELCEKRFLRKTRLTFHKCVIHGIGTEQLTCTICKKILGTKHTLMKHMENIHDQGMSDEESLEIIPMDSQNEAGGYEKAPRNNNVNKRSKNHASFPQDGVVEILPAAENGDLEVSLCLPLDEPIEIAITRDDD